MAEHGRRGNRPTPVSREADWGTGRVDIPLDIEDNPLREMVESGDLKPAKE